MTYGPLQAATNQYSTVYPRSPGDIPGMPTIERVSIESGDCSEPRSDIPNIGDYRRLSDMPKSFIDDLEKVFGAEASMTVKQAYEKTREYFLFSATKGNEWTETILRNGDSSKFISVYANYETMNPIKSSSAGVKINAFNVTLKFNLAFDDIGAYVEVHHDDRSNALGLRADLSEFKVGVKWSTEEYIDENSKVTAYNSFDVSGLSIVSVLIFYFTGQYSSSAAIAYA